MIQNDPVDDEVYLIAVAGNPNYGDELIVRVWLRELARTHPNIRVWLDTPHPGPASALLADEHPNLRTTDTVWRLRDLAGSDDPETVSQVIRAAVLDSGYAPWWSAGIDVIRRVRSIHVVGGGYINKTWAPNIGVLLALGELASHLPARMAITGAGLLPLDALQRDLVRSALANFSVVDLRDAPSFDGVAPTAGSAHVSLTGDDVFLSEPSALLDPETAGRFDIGVVVQGDLVTAPVERIYETVVTHLKAWDAVPERVAVVECIPRVDSHIREVLEQRVGPVQYYSFAHLWRHGFPADFHQRWISTRFHPHLLAALAGARGAALPVEPEYYPVKHSSLTTLGSGWPVLGPEDGPASVLRQGTLAERAKSVRRRKRELFDLIYG